MDTVDRAAKVLALSTVKNRSYTQPDRLGMLFDYGIDGALTQVAEGDTLFGFDLAPYVTEVESWISKGLSFATALDPEYPQQIITARDAPLLMFYEGILDHKEMALAVVGSRNATDLQLQAARDVVRVAGDLGFAVVSGLAAGIDTAAHAEALKAGIRTVAVMGTGIDKTYPAANKALREEIVASGGTVMTQFRPGTGPTQWNFPMRNATMSAYSVATVVVAASEKSGTRHQAKQALAHGRQVYLTSGVLKNAKWADQMRTHTGVTVIESPRQLGDHLDLLRSDLELIQGIMV